MSKEVTNDLGEKPELKWIRTDELFVDHEYQRGTQSDASKKSIKYLIENFSWAYCGALIVSYVTEKKKYAVLDGQHRLMAARGRKDISELPCIVTRGIAFKAQARGFVVINTKRIKLNNLAAFHAAVAAGDPVAVEIKKILDQAKIEIPKNPVFMAETEPRQVQSIGTLVRLLKTHTPAQIIWVLTIIPEAYGDAKGQMRSTLIKALAGFIKNNPDCDRKQMIRTLEDIDPIELEDQAQSYVRIRGGSTVNAVIETLERLYKKGKKKAA